MKQLLKKEFSLAVHPTSWLFLGLSAMVLIPNYPYYVIFFYTGLGVFFTCLNGRENQDVLFSLLLPVSRKQVVRARITTVVLLELLQLLLTALFSLLRRALPLGENAAGMEANLALLGLGLVVMTLGHGAFFRVYYKNVQKVGVAFLWCSAVEFISIGILEVMAHTVPLFRDYLDTPDPAFLTKKLLVLALGAAVYGLLTFLTYRRAVRDFEAQNL